jgi:hypothetical protein
MFLRTQQTPDAGRESRLMASCLYEVNDRTAEKDGRGPRVAERLEPESVLMIECTIPPDTTIAEWRRKRAAERSRHRSGGRLPQRLHRRAARAA